MILENFAHTLDEVIEHTDVETVIVTGVGDQLALAEVGDREFRRAACAQTGAARGDLPRAVALQRGTSSRDAISTARRWSSTHDDIAFLQYTGGTTGVAKGAMLTHRNMVANVLQSAAWIGTARGSART